MTDSADAIRRELANAHGEALKVGDSPVRADRLAVSIERIRGSVATADLGEEREARVSGYIDDALRVLRRDDDGREAARHLQSAMRLFEGGPRRPSPFLDD